MRFAFPGFGIVATLIMSLVVAGCGSRAPRFIVDPPSPAAPPLTEAVPRMPAEPAPVFAVRDVPTIAVPSPPAPAPVAALPAKPPGPDQPNELIGLTMRLLTDRLGKPDFVQRDGPAEIWRYAGSDCFLDVFLYQRSGDLRVAHFEVRGGGIGGSRPVARPQSAIDCYRDLRSHQGLVPG